MKRKADIQDAPETKEKRARTGEKEESSSGEGEFPARPEGPIPETLEIDLAFRSLVYLGSLKDEEIPEALRPAMRTLALNLVEFQYRFARPMELPFMLGKDHEETLDMPRPIQVLLRYRVAYPTTRTLQGLDDGMEADGHRYCFLGHATWTEEVKAGALKSTDAETVPVSGFDWLGDLFRVLELAKDFNPERRAVARRLASAWFHVCTQVDLSDEPDEPEENEEDMAKDLVGALSGIFGMGGDEDEDEEEEDGEFEGDGEDEDEDEDAMDVDEPEEPAPRRSARQSSRKSGDAAEQKDGDGEGEGYEEEGEEDEEDFEVVEQIDDERPVSEQEKALREVAFRVVTNLNAYMPDPTEDQEWFKRVLKHVRLSQSLQELGWYPWGCPPIAKIIDGLRSDDTFLKSTSAAIVQLFQQHANMNQGLEKEEGDE